MAASRDTRTLIEVVEVRRIQRRAAEMAVARADAALQEFDTQRSVTLASLHDEQASWGAVVSEPRLDLQLATAWARTVTATQADLSGLDEQIVEAGKDRARKADAWRDTLARVNAAEDLARAAAVRERHRREEAALGDVADRVTQRRRVR